MTWSDWSSFSRFSPPASSNLPSGLPDGYFHIGPSFRPSAEKVAHPERGGVAGPEARPAPQTQKQPMTRM